ncbi:MAG: erythromycin esterase family protein [Saprospiraceae bacterium]
MVREILLLVCLIPYFGFGQCNPTLNEYITGFDNLESNSFHFLKDKLEDVKILGYGEDTHGSSEFTLLAKELMKYLAENHHYNTLIIETGFGEGLFLNDYIQGERDDINAILETHNSTWRYKTEEFLLLMEWLRDYNHHSTDKISLFGCEMQYVISDIHRIEAYLQKVESVYKIDGFQKHLWQNIDDVEKSEYYHAYTKLKAYFVENYENFVGKTSEKEFEMAFQHIEVLGQFVTTIHQSVYQRKMDFRDVFMAENIEWIFHHQGSSTKAMYWAHNDHVGDWVANGIVDVAGHFLKKQFGKNYYNISTDFGTGEFLAFPHNPEEVGGHMRTFNFESIDTSTFTYCIQQQGKPNAFVDLRSARHNEELRCYLDAPIKIMYGAGSQEWGTQTRTIDIGRAFDAIIYLDKISTIHFIK